MSRGHRARLAALAGLAALLLGACGSSAPPGDDPVARARQALAEGSPKRALAALGDAKEGPALVLRLRALIATSAWGDVEALLRRVPAGAERDAITCLFAAEREDVGAVRRCEAAAALPFDDAALGDEVAIALSAVLEREHRPDEAERTLKALVERRPHAPNRRALVDFYERQGYVREAVQAAEAWFREAPADPTLRVRLGQLLERKAKGDLLDKRYAEAEAAARRLLELVPTRHVARFHLADALEQLGRKDEALAERAKARAAGAEPPPPSTPSRACRPTPRRTMTRASRPPTAPAPSTRRASTRTRRASTRTRKRKGSSKFLFPERPHPVVVGLLGVVYAIGRRLSTRARRGP